VPGLGAIIAVRAALVLFVLPNLQTLMAGCDGHAFCSVAGQPYPSTSEGEVLIAYSRASSLNDCAIRRGFVQTTNRTRRRQRIQCQSRKKTTAILRFVVEDDIGGDAVCTLQQFLNLGELWAWLSPDPI